MSFPRIPSTPPSHKDTQPVDKGTPPHSNSGWSWLPKRIRNLGKTVAESAASIIRPSQAPSVVSSYQPDRETMEWLMGVCGDKRLLHDACSQTFPSSELELEFRHSGASDDEPATRRAYLEWKLAQYQDGHHWVQDLGSDVTFPTETLSLDPNEGAAIIAYYQHHVLEKKAPSTEHTQAYSSLKARLMLLFERLEVRTGSKDSFIRLSTRSPKDAALYSGNRCHEILKENLKEAFTSLKAQGLEGSAAKNAERISLAQAASHSLKVDNASDALDLLIQSERVHRDLLVASKFPNLWDMKLMLREFVQIPYSHEFRCFVHNKQLIAVSQYDPYLYFESLNDEGEQAAITEKLTSFFKERVQGQLDMEHYVLDLAMIPEGDDQKVVVIEVNSYDHGTGPALFDWNEDATLLMGQEEREAPEIRVVEHLEDTNGANAYSQWEDLISSVKAEL